MKKSCPYCAEDIQAEAVRCPHCRSRLGTFTVEGWHRGQPGRVVAGVATALSQALGVPVTLVRAAFVVLGFVHLLGFVAYGLLWLLIPRDPGEPSILETALARAQEMARKLSGRDGGSRSSRCQAQSDSESTRIALNDSGGER